MMLSSSPVPRSGWISFYIRSEGDVEKAIRLLRLSYNNVANSRLRDKANIARASFYTQ